MSIFEETQKCLFCGKPKTWRSVLVAMNSRTRTPLFTVTICPEDRKTHTIEQIYEKVIEKFRETATKELVVKKREKTK